MNERIRSHEVRVIDDEGQMLGLMPIFDALKYAKDRSLDLVEMTVHENVPTCKLMDYGKWKFETKKKEKINRKKQVKVLIKELQMRPRTDENDINIKLQKAREFLLEGHKVKINVLFSGREMAHKELGFQLLQKVEGRLSDVSYIETPAKMEGRSLFSIFSAGSPSAKTKLKSPVDASPSKPSPESKVVTKTPDSEKPSKS